MINIFIKTFFVLMSLFVSGLMALLFYYMVVLKESVTTLNTMEIDRAKMIVTVDELQQGRDDIARYARTFVAVDGPEYYKVQEQTILTAEEFLYPLSVRSKISVTDMNVEIEDIFVKIQILVSIGFITFLFSLFIVRQKLLVPMKRLTRTMLAFQNGEEDIKEVIYSNDEFGLMAKQFFVMKKKLDLDYEVIQKQALEDPLTGISNRRAFFEVSEQLLKIAERSDEPFSIMMLDIDFFKALNDRHGHNVGDDVLKHFTKTVADVLRKSDLFARYGGEEFIVLLPHTDIAGGLKIAEKIRLEIENRLYTTKSISVPVTVSIGVSQYRDDKLIKEVIKRADEALYRAKNSGRNRVESESVSSISYSNLQNISRSSSSAVISSLS